MRRRTTPLIAFAAAYGLILAAVFGAVSAGQSAALGVFFCSPPTSGGDPAPVLPAGQGLDCCIACAGGPAALPAPAAAGIAVPALTRVVWPVIAADFFRLPINGSPFARAPPPRL